MYRSATFSTYARRGWGGVGVVIRQFDRINRFTCKPEMRGIRWNLIIELFNVHAADILEQGLVQFISTAFPRYLESFNRRLSDD